MGLGNIISSVLGTLISVSSDGMLSFAFYMLISTPAYTVAMGTNISVLELVGVCQGRLVARCGYESVCPLVEGSGEGRLREGGGEERGGRREGGARGGEGGGRGERGRRRREG